jgi:methylated-DNA-[protein]-cysteine S-methyltransferase
VYVAARAITFGETRTYGDLARDVGGSERAIGVAMSKNPVPIVVPCHRVVSSDGAGGFSAPGGLSTKATLLTIEGCALGDPEHRAARRHLMKVDDRLAPIVKRVECTLPVKSRGNLFRMLVRAIAGQQLSTKAAATIFARVEGAIAAPAEVDATWARQGGASRDEWRDAPARVLEKDVAELRALGLSEAKTRAIRELAAAVTDGSLRLDDVVHAPDEEAIATLVRQRGIGRWTVEMLLIFELGRPDVLPVDDLGIRKAVQKVYGLRALPEAKTIERIAEPWRPWRSIGSFYLWRSLDTE